jgi:hypothetical protein
MGLKAQKFFRGAGMAAAVFGALGALSVPFVHQTYEAKSILTQRVQVDSADKLFNDGPTPIGSPQKMIIEDPKAVIGTKDGIRLVNDGYLQSHHIYPLQLKTVDFDLENARTGFIVVSALGWLILLLIYRKQKREQLAAESLPTESQSS